MTRPRLSAKTIARLKREDAEAAVCNLIWPDGHEDDRSPLQEALLYVYLDRGPLQELVDSGELTRAERDRLVAIRRLWPRHLYGPLFRNGKRGRMLGERATVPAFERYAAELVLKEKAERLADYATYEPPKTTLGHGELKRLFDWALGQALEKFPNGKDRNSAARIRSLVRHPDRLR